MPANVAPIFTRKSNIQWGTLTAANNVYDGTGTLDAYGTATVTTGHLATLFAASTDQDSRIERIRVMALGTNAASVLRLFLNNGSTNATAANNSYIGEIALAASTANAAGITNASASPLELPNLSANTGDLTCFPIVVPRSYKLMGLLGTAAAAGWQVTIIGGDY